MQSFIKAALLISALAFVLTGCGVIRTAEPVTNTYEFDGDITDIIISTTACDVVLVPSGDGRTTVVCHEADTLLHEVTLEKGVLRIKKKSSRTGISFNNMDLRIEVSFPVKNYNGLTAETNSGGISVDGAFSCMDAELKTTSGGIRFSGKVAGKLYSDSSSGGQHLTGVDCTSVRATSTSGGIHAETVSGKDLRFEATSGSIEMTGVICGDLEAETTSGNIRFSGCDADSITLKATSGNIKGSFLTGKRFTAKTGSGSVSVPDDTPGSGTCKATTGSGDVKITVEKTNS